VVDRPDRVAAGMSAEDSHRAMCSSGPLSPRWPSTPRRSFTSRIAPTSKPESFGPAASRSPPPGACSPSLAAWPGRCGRKDPERAAVTAYQYGVWLGRAIVPVDAIAPGRRRRSGTKWSGL